MHIMIFRVYIYHPDSREIIIGMLNEERLIVFQKIQHAYQNIKNAMNVTEVDLPKYIIDYIPDNEVELEDELKEYIKEHEGHEEHEEHEGQKIFLNLNRDIFDEKFNKIFEKKHSFENEDNPYSIYYNEPTDNNKNIQDSQIILKDSNCCKQNNLYEFGVNYIEDHSCENYSDIRNNNNNLSDLSTIKNEKKIRESTIEAIEEFKNDLENKLQDMLNIRNENITI